MATRFSPTLFLVGFTLTAGLISGCKATPPPAPPQIGSHFSHFVGLDQFDAFARSQDASGETVLLSPTIEAGQTWNQLIVSWNADAPPGTFVKLEASAIIASGHQTKFYTMGIWSLDNKIFQRESVSGQRDVDGNVDTDTLRLVAPAHAAQLRVTLGGTNGAAPTLKFVGLSFADTKAAPATAAPNTNVWGKIVPTPGHSQHGYPNEHGWCSPTSVSMVLSRWAEVLHRPEMDLTVPTVAADVYDDEYRGTGNWPFNTAFAGSFPGMRAYVTRFDNLTEVENWIAAGLPVVLSTRWDYLKDGRPLDDAGHLVVCTGFTTNGDVVINDPATRLDRHEAVQHIYNRQNVIRSWGTSHNTVYLVYPEGTTLPENLYGQW